MCRATRTAIPLDMVRKARAKVVIVGGGFGGLRVADRLANTEFDVTLTDRRNHHLFQPLLYQVATAGLAVSDIAMPLRSVLRKASNVRIVLDEVVDIDRSSRLVKPRDVAPIPYDYLVVAAGAKTRLPSGKPGEQVFGLKTLEDARAIRERVLTCFELAEREDDAQRRAALTTFVVVGGGPTGVEMAGAIRELARTSAGLAKTQLSLRDVRVILVELGERVLAGFNPSLSAAAQAQLEAMGVEVRTEIGVKFCKQPDRVRVGDEEVSVGAVVWAAGVIPVDLAACLGETASDGRVIVGQDCSLIEFPEVFVIGDMAQCQPEGASEPLPGLAPVAMQQGEHVARQVRRSVEGKPREVFKYKDRGTMATIGRSRAVAQKGRFRASGFSAWLAWLVVHLATLVGFRNRLAVFVNWAWQYMTYRRGHRILLPSSERLDQPRRDLEGIQPGGGGNPARRASSCIEREADAAHDRAKRGLCGHRATPPRERAFHDHSRATGNLRWRPTFCASTRQERIVLAANVKTFRQADRAARHAFYAAKGR